MSQEAVRGRRRAARAGSLSRRVSSPEVGLGKNWVPMSHLLPGNLSPICERLWYNNSHPCPQLWGRHEGSQPLESRIQESGGAWRKRSRPALVVLSEPARHLCPCSTSHPGPMPDEGAEVGARVSHHDLRPASSGQTWTVEATSPWLKILDGRCFCVKVKTTWSGVFKDLRWKSSYHQGISCARHQCPRSPPLSLPPSLAWSELQAIELTATVQ